MTKKLSYNWRVQRANERATKMVREYRIIYETGRCGRYDYYVAEVTWYDGKIEGIGPIVNTYDDLTEWAWDTIMKAMKEAYSKPILEWKTTWSFKDIGMPKKGTAKVTFHNEPKRKTRSSK